MDQTAFPNTNELFIRPGRLYPTLLQGIIPSPYIERKEQGLFDIIGTINYDTKGFSRNVLDRCIMNVLLYRCEYNSLTMEIISGAVKETKLLAGT